MTGVEIAVGYFIAWAMRKARRVATAADQEVDRGIDAGMERLHDLISAKIGAEPAVQQLATEAEAGEQSPNNRTRQRIQLAVEDAVEQDPAFAAALQQLVEELVRQEQTAGGVSAADRSVAVAGDLTIQRDAFRAENGSVAAFIVSDVTMGNPQTPGAEAR